MKLAAARVGRELGLAGAKARLYRIARRSAIGLAVWLGIVEQRQHAPKEVVSMLVRLNQSCDRRGE